MKRCVRPLMLLATAACVEAAEPTTFPRQVIPALISATDLDLEPGETSTLTLTITNTLEEDVELVFPTSCQALIFIRSAGGRVFTPENGTYECAAVPSLLPLAAGDSAQFSMEWGGGIEFGPAGSSPRVPPGTYYAYGEMRADNYHAIAFPITIVVR
ncbi:MAG TPA: BsuPI-related putative proteinase inhibitor [Gemmatimonadaceae bacterium]